MPEIQPTADDAAALISPPEPRSALFFDGIDWRVARVSATGYLEIDVLTSALPAGAATEATLASADAYLALIALIRNALQTVQTDRLIVRGEDQLFSYKESLAVSRTGVVSGADGSFDSNTPAAGLVWIVTNIRAVDETSPTTQHAYWLPQAAPNVLFYQVVAALGAGDNTFYHGQIWLDVGDRVHVVFPGSLAGDQCRVDLSGYVMTLET